MDPLKLLAVCALAGSGCAYRLALTSAPTPVEVRLPDGRVVATPTEVRFRWVPFGEQRIVASAPGYRPLDVDLRKSEIRWWHYVGDTLARPATVGGAPRGEVHLMLIPEHGPAGTWSAEDIP